MGGTCLRTRGSWSKNFSGSTHFCFTTRGWGSGIRWSAFPIHLLHLAVEFGERVDDDLAEERLDGSFVFRGVVLEDAGKNGDEIGWGVEDSGNA